MSSPIRQAFTAGYETLSAWAGLLDRINVFPVADGDTGANLRVSLAPLRDCAPDPEQTRSQLARCAMGNSGNIAAAFFRELCLAQTATDLAAHAGRGREQAWRALAWPRPGTMLTVFDSLADTLAHDLSPGSLYPLLSDSLQAAVLATTELLPELQQAGVVDSGALGMYAFFDGFFRNLAGHGTPPDSLLTRFPGRLAISADFHAASPDGYCVNATIRSQDDQTGAASTLAALGESVVILAADSGFKVHIHTDDRVLLRQGLSALGEITDWHDENMAASAGELSAPEKTCIHIMTDAAGSLSRDMARQHGITLLDSYILTDGRCIPETLFPANDLYPLMRGGARVTTAQASNSERHQHYRNVCQQFGRTLYLCVGSAFTGNHAVACRWKEEHDPGNLVGIVDTGAASGRLALIALLASRLARRTTSPDDVQAQVRTMMADCEEYIFLDTLTHLVAGGRVSWARGFVANLLHMKPVIRQVSNDVRKAGVVHNARGQIEFALEKLRRSFTAASAPVIMLQYSDNGEWVEEAVRPRITSLLPEAEIILAPLSLTSGVHMGPGTWSLAWTGGR